jgi:hypothetical protein
MHRTLLAFAAGFMLFASTAPVFGQTRSWVSGTGNDANPCSRTAPCKTFAGAFLKTPANGEINVVDAGAYGGVTITKSISIVAEGPTAGVLVIANNAIIINSATANVTLRGLDIEGLGTSMSGIKIVAANTVNIEKCRIAGFKVDSGTVSAAIDVENTGSVDVVISDSTIWNNLRGISVLPAAGGTAKVVIDRVRLQSNNQGIRTATGGTLFLSNSVVTQGSSGIVITGAGIVNSFGNNVISGNTTDVSNNPLTPANLQ